MNGKTFKQGYKGTLEKNRLQKYAILMLVGINLMLAVAIMNKRERIVLVPPMMQERMELAYAAANEPYYKSFGLYTANFIGNINPSNAEFVTEGLSLSFSPELYQSMRNKIYEDAQKMKQSGRSLRFYADRVIYEKDTGKTFVAGKQEIVTAAGNVHEQDITFEMQIVITDGLPRIEKFTNYNGAPRTDEWLQRNRHTQTQATAGS